MNLSKRLSVKFKVLHPDAVLPDRQNDRGMEELFFRSVDSYVIEPGKFVVISTGLEIELTGGYILLSSDILSRYNCFVLNNYIFGGEVKVLVYNAGHERYLIKKGMRVFQGVIVPYVVKMELLNS